MASIFARFFGRTVSEAAGVAAGIAVAAPLRPVVQLVENETWAIHPDKPVPAPLAAAIVAEDVERQPWGEQQASWTGFSADSFDAMLGEALNAPGLGELFEAWRRSLIDDAAFTHGLRKAKLEPRWDAPLKALKLRLLSSDELANAQQQQFIDEARANEEAALQGVTAERQQIRFRLAGLPPGVATAQEYLNRGLIDDATFDQIVAEGHTKTKYTDVLRRGARFVLSPINYVEGRLRGWLTDAEMYAGTALHGVTQEDTHLLFQIHGRPLSWHQVWIGLQRGGVYDGPTTDIAAPFLKALQESNIRPEWYNLAWAQRYTYPSAFVMRALTADGTLTAAQAEADLIDMGWRPDRAKQAATKWAGTDTTGGKEQTKAELIDEFEGGFITESELRDHLTALGWQGAALDLEVHLADARRIKSWRDKGITALGKRYVASTMDQAAADGYLQELGVTDPDTRGRIIGVWNIEREFK
jgi:hypothetical protein